MSTNRKQRRKRTIAIKALLEALENERRYVAR
jgi:hypothetical protein